MDGTVADSVRSSTPLTARERIERHALANEIMRVRSVLLAASVVWGIGVGFDLVTYEIVGGGPLWLILTARVSVLVYILAVGRRLSRGVLTRPRLTRTLIISTFPLTSLAHSILAAALGGVTSPYIGGIYVVLICQGAAVMMHWRRGLVLASITTWMFPLGMLIGAAVSPEVRAQLADSHLRKVFIFEAIVLFSAGSVATWASHALWMLRQRLVESGSVGRYRLLRRIGRGGMGEVWQAHDRATRRDVALKILAQRIELADTQETRAAIDRFEREIETTARLDHPNVVRILDWGATDDGIWYYAMELLDGADLASLVERHGPLPVPVVVHVGLQAARALGSAHAAGIVHRDIKPANLYVIDRRGTVDIKVLDFGIARVQGDDGLTKTGALIGTPAFMSPEAAAGHPAEPASDVWSLAATLRFAMTGKQPHEASTIDVPLELATVFDAAMATSTAGRLRDGSALADALARIAVGGPLAVPGLERVAKPFVDAEAPTIAPEHAQRR